MKIDIKLRGWDELVRVFQALPDRLQQTVYRKALSMGANPILKEARNRAPKPKIRRNTIKKLNRKGSALGPLTISIITRKAYNPVTNVGSRRIRPYGENDAFWSVWYEFGKRGQPATPYMGPAFRAKQREAIEEFRKAFKLGIEREVAKLYSMNKAAA